jgi:hypothetical protein
MPTGDNRIITTEVRSFIKKNGDEREMHFVKLDKLPEEFLKEQLKGSNKKRNLEEGLEVVWDLEKNGFRIFNWNTTIGEPYFRVLPLNLLFEKYINIH